MVGGTKQPRPGTLLDLLDEPLRGELGNLGISTRFARGERLIHVGDPGEWVMLVTSGVAQVVGEDANGATVILDIAAAGDLIGEAAVLDPDHPQRMASVVAMSTVVVRRIPAPEFRAFLDKHSEAAIGLLVIANRRMRIAQHQRTVTQTRVSFQHIAERLDYLLDTCGYRTQHGWAFTVPWTREDLADFIPTGRTTLITKLTRFEDHGIIARARKFITVTDRARLTAVAQGRTTLE
ncbi:MULTISPECIES: Crp/Fnr family transcriptional regulator [Prauserella salsuginis group]|uniref:Crp/Fnr family transcriptional regulator n=1 Tax=Prauserella salsuginis TaxID=387889 RepID=A0ABW6G046_9PSEU|nr:MULTISPECIES: Crp/Fnr family transcriptional regulator [Prauserella salsuginis group]MCR3721188.1 cAMP-binding domain of CRP or a regulatory subunit of cAMP-dependent protein kinases [Prauserella flava]MCR3734731.1 cAMP-binding domain of CRP or a regulatory subunit of cAMP-dependent protein kinases [Prauserella salsuginis]